jgi:hypothetical protein
MGRQPIDNSFDFNRLAFSPPTLQKVCGYAARSPQ